VLYVARQDDLDRHHGVVFQLHESVFAPPQGAIRDHRLGRLSATAFRSLYLDHLQALWRQDPEAFLCLIALASGKGRLTLVDDWGDEAQAPRRILAASLKQLAATRRDGERRAQRRQGMVPPVP
jgi:hypothetical protein